MGAGVVAFLATTQPALARDPADQLTAYVNARSADTDGAGARAAKAEPANVEINQHLGDALWQVGRRFEAHYAWAAASVYADAEDAARIESKIATGLTSEASNR